MMERLLAVALGLSLPASAFAHVKWFASYDLLCPPRPAFAVFFGEYFMMFCLVVGPLMFGVALVDRYLTRRQCMLHRRATALTDRLSAYFPTVLRLGVSGFLGAVFLYSGLHGGMILTPELKTDAEWVRWIQLGIAMLVLFPRTAFLAGFGIIFLYGYAMMAYGVFHLLDYPIFLGVAIYLIIDSLYGQGRRELGHTVLRVLTAVTLLWAGIEKFAYPEWSFQLIEQRPDMVLGFDPEFFMVAAGFVEFCAAYLLLTGMLSARAAAIMLLMLFLSAILGFGMIDAIGHSVIIVVLLMLAFSVNPVAHRFDARRGIAATALRHTWIFFGALMLFMGLYYGGHYLSYQIQGGFGLF
jgi:uncharacterized membrane protein YphA (DoxX/SURF4 family)